MQRLLEGDRVRRAVLHGEAQRYDSTLSMLDAADLGHKLTMPILVLWGQTSSVGKRFAIRSPSGGSAPRMSAAKRC
jgi:hypothetical protein